MRPLSETLTDLIVLAEAVVSRPRSMAVAKDVTPLPTLAAEIRRAAELPAEDVRTTQAALIMAIALKEFFDGDREPGSQWLGVAGVVLPLLRVEAWAALNNEKAARAPEQAEPYAGRARTALEDKRTS